MEAANAPTSSANKYLQKSSMGHIRKHFNLTVYHPCSFCENHSRTQPTFPQFQNESGARCLIDQFLVAAVIYAQSILDLDVAVRDDVFEHYQIDSPFVAVFTEVPIPYTKVRCGNTSYTFHGVLDYGVGFISTTLKGKLIYPFLFSYFTVFH